MASSKDQRDQAVLSVSPKACRLCRMDAISYFSSPPSLKHGSIEAVSLKYGGSWRQREVEMEPLFLLASTKISAVDMYTNV
jgi:hypothetical protein